MPKKEKRWMRWSMNHLCHNFIIQGGGVNDTYENLRLSNGLGSSRFNGCSGCGGKIVIISVELHSSGEAGRV